MSNTTIKYSELIEEAHRIKAGVPLLDYFFKLQEAGILQYVKKIGKEEFFGFQHQKTGSIAVNTQKNIWYDHSSGEGGDIIKACQKFENKSFFEAIETFKSILSVPISGLINQERRPSNCSHIVNIDIVQDMINHPYLINYLSQRGLNLSSLAGFAKQVHWSLGEKKFYAIGLKNINGGFSVRSSVFKGNLNENGISIFKVGKLPTSVKIFEGLIDFGSYRTLQPEQNYIAFILNSTANLTDKVIEKIKNNANILSLKLRGAASLVHLYLDNDKAGRLASNKVLDKVECAEDRSYFYSDVNDLNDFLKIQQNKE